MFGSAVWLLWVLSQQVGPIAMLGITMGLVFLAFGLWLWGHSPTKNPARLIVRLLAVTFILIPAGFLPVHETAPPQAQADMLGETYSAEKLAEALKSNDPVFVEMTAAWCITCKVNHKVAINIPSTLKLFADHNVHYLVGDWTNQDAEITKYLDSFGRSGVPIYVYYGRPDTDTGKRPEPVVLPQILTPGIIAGTIN
jgi:thiol:disulfide interchange protein